jgi:hypothetical protein
MSDALARWNTPSRTLVVNPNTGRIHRKTCGSVNYFSMFSVRENLFNNLDAEYEYSRQREWVACLLCRPFAADVPAETGDDQCPTCGATGTHDCRDYLTPNGQTGE